jgi:hypothetical protein
MVDLSIVFGQRLGGEDMVPIQAACEVFLGQIRAELRQYHMLAQRTYVAYPDRIISSSIPYSFICCKPQPSLIRRGIHCFLRPVKLGVWNIRTSTRSGPYFSTNEHRRDAQEGFGVSRVPRRASVRIETWRSGFSRRA